MLRPVALGLIVLLFLFDVFLLALLLLLLQLLLLLLVFPWLRPSRIWGVVSRLVDQFAQFLNVVDLAEFGSVVRLLFSFLARISFGSLLLSLSLGLLL